MIARSRLRRRWRSVVVVALLIAVAGGVVLGALAGARRTRSALDRLGRETHASTVGVLLFDGANPRLASRIGRLPGVQQSGQLVVWAASIVDRSNEETPIVVAVDDRYGRTVDRSVLVAGRRAHRAGEVVVAQNLARRKAYHLGSRIRVVTFAADQLPELVASQNGLSQPLPNGPTISLRVVGIDRRVGDLSTQGERTGILTLGAPVYRKYGDRVLAYTGLVRVRLSGESTAQFTRQIRAIARGHRTQFDTGGLDTGGVDDSLSVLAIGLSVFAALGALGAFVTLAVLLARWAGSWSREQPVELALGQRAGTRIAAVALPVLPAIVVGSFGAVVLAAITSVWMPIGVAHSIEPHTGFAIDWPVLGVGLAAVVLATATVTLVAAWWGSRRARWDAPPRRTTAAARALGAITGWRLPVPAVIGSRMALDPGRGSTAVPGRSAIAAAALGTAGIVAALVVGASLQRLGAEPARWSYGYDAIAEGGGGLTHDPDDPSCAPVTTTLSDLHTIEALANLCQSSVTVDGATMNAVGLGPIRGTIRPLMLRGHAPTGPRQIALGEKTLSRLGRSIDDDVLVRGENGRVRARIVGTTLLPTPNAHDTVTLADGALMRADTLAKLGPGTFPQIVIRWRPGTDIGRAQRAVVRITGAPAIAPVRPPEINRLLQIDDLPTVLAAFLGLLALVGITHAVVTNATRRRRDLALLQTLGLRTRQVVETVASHATTLAGIGLVIGIPLGIVVGRGAWTVIAHDVGVAADASMPWRLLALMVPMVLLAVLAVAAIPARRASRAHPAIALRSE